MTELQVESSSLVVLSLFRCPLLSSVSLFAPVLTTLYVSQWAISLEQLEAVVCLLPRTLAHLFLCELAQFDFALLPKLLDSLSGLRYLNLYRSGRPGKELNSF